MEYWKNRGDSHVVEINLDEAVWMEKQLGEEGG